MPPAHTRALARRRLLTLALASVVPAVLSACGRKPRGQPVAAGANVLALGDSITYGLGAAPDESYPEVLARLTGWKVINAGVSGDTSAQALARLPALLEEHRPALVLVSIGGNDFLRRMPEAITRANVRSICQQATASGAQVLLVGVPAFSLAATLGSLSDHALYAELAKELKLPLHAGGWSAVLGDPDLRSDAIHGNAKGYERFAQGLAETARDSGMR